MPNAPYRAAYLGVFQNQEPELDQGPWYRAKIIFRALIPQERPPNSSSTAIFRRRPGGFAVCCSIYRPTVVRQEMRRL